MATVTDYLVWYAKHRETAKYRPILVGKTPGEEGASEYFNLALASGTDRLISEDEAERKVDLPNGSRIFATDTAASDGFRVNTSGNFSWSGVEYDSTQTRNWKATTPGMLRPGKANRLQRRPGLRIYRRYFDDFLVRLASGKTLVLEIKGEDSEQNRAKRAAMELWVAAVNAKGGFGVWSSDVAFDVSRLHNVLERHVSVPAGAPSASPA